MGEWNYETVPCNHHPETCNCSGEKPLEKYNMTTTEQLRKLVIENPELEIVTMTHYEVCASDDYSYWMAYPSSVNITSLYTFGDRVYFDDDVEELEDIIFEELEYDMKLEDKDINKLSKEEQENLIQERLQEMILERKVLFKEKVICIYITP